MSRLISVFLAGVCATCICACKADRPTPASDDARLHNDLVGKWRLVKADGKPLAELSLKSQEIELAADGTWTSNIAFGGQMDGMTVKGGGKWSLQGDSISYTNGQESGKSKVTLTAGKLTLDPDFHLRKNDGSKAPLIGEYER